MKKLAIILTFVLLSIVALGCGSKSVTVPTGDGGSANISSDGKDVTLKTDEGSLQISGDEENGSIKGTDAQGNKFEMNVTQTIPDSFPKSIPIPDGAKITSSMSSSSDDQGDSIVVMYELDGDFKEISKLYTDFLKNEGYSDTSTTEMGDTYMGGGTKDGMQLSIVLSKDASSGLISCMLTYATNKTA